MRIRPLIAIIALSATTIAYAQTSPKPKKTHQIPTEQSAPNTPMPGTPTTSQQPDGQTEPRPTTAPLPNDPTAPDRTTAPAPDGPTPGNPPPPKA
ncbi:MAG: hypothetical protein K2Y20_03465 [Sphingomonas sp.]|nr:hypothetical protein [Sphingomonas sp.]